MKNYYLKYLIFILFLLQNIRSDAANVFEIRDGSDKGFDLIVGYQYQRYNTLELGIARGYRGKGMGKMVYGNYHLCSEVLLKIDNTYNGKVVKTDKLIYGLKSGCTLSILFFDVSGQLTYYTDFYKNSSFALRPEVGLSFFGFLDLNVGRNIVLSTKDPMNLNAFVFVARITYGKSSRNV